MPGRHRRGIWEPASGAAEPGETFAEAAARELAEAARLVVDLTDVQVPGTLSWTG
nr:NUDIX domain-containing protein [Streptomyces cupreus]